MKFYEYKGFTIQKIFDTWTAAKAERRGSLRALTLGQLKKLIEKEV